MRLVLTLTVTLAILACAEQALPERRMNGKTVDDEQDEQPLEDETERDSGEVEGSSSADGEDETSETSDDPVFIEESEEDELTQDDQKADSDLDVKLELESNPIGSDMLVAALNLTGVFTHIPDKAPVTSGILAEQATVDQICKFAGFTKGAIKEQDGWMSCADNRIAKWNPTKKDFDVLPACKSGNTTDLNERGKDKSHPR